MAEHPKSTPPEEVQPAAYLDRYRCLRCHRDVLAHRTGRGRGDWLGVSPRFAWALCAALEMLGDEWVESPEAVDAPPIARSLLADRSFRERMKASAHRLADEVAAGRIHAQMARCTADEVNLAIAVEDTIWILEGDLVYIADDLHDACAADDDGDWRFACDAVREDGDVEILWRMDLDGLVEDATVAQHMGWAHLRPCEWFAPFTYATATV